MKQDPASCPASEKMSELRAWLRDQGSVLIAFSGGVDSTFLLKVASQELADNAYAATARSPTYPERELHEAEQLARDMGVCHFIVDSQEVDLPGYRENPPDRCYFCKSELFTQLNQLARENGIATVCDGANSDDLSDHRPGRRAACELRIASPLAELGFTKAEIREHSARLGLPTADKPSFACLASRFPYGEEITVERLRIIDAAESALQRLDLGQVRVRYHGTVARVEVDPSQFLSILEHAEDIVAALKNCGFSYVTLDLQGYRTGSMNETMLTPDTGSCKAAKASRKKES